jgi:tRNA pseudouridine55 synthase
VNAQATSSRPAQAHGLLILDKPSGPTSYACLDRIKKKLGQKKIGHAGTLDPLASGVLLALLGRATKLAPFLTGCDKTYRGRLKLGLTTDTYDIQGTVVAESSIQDVAPQSVREAMLDWEKQTVQEVPAYSAAKVKGRPMHEMARKGEDVPVKLKEISVTEVEVLALDLPFAEFRVTVSAGAYIRSLVHSLGQRLSCGAALTELIREQSRPFGLDQAHALDEVLADPDGLPGRVLPLAQALPHWDAIRLSPPLVEQVRNGHALPARAVSELEHRPGAQALFLTDEGDALAIVEAAEDRPAWRIVRGLW